MALLALEREGFVGQSILQAGADQPSASRMGGRAADKACGWAGRQGLGKVIPTKN